MEDSRKSAGRHVNESHTHVHTGRLVLWLCALRCHLGHAHRAQDELRAADWCCVNSYRRTWAHIHTHTHIYIYICAERRIYIRRRARSVLLLLFRLPIQTQPGTLVFFSADVQCRDHAR